MLLCYDTKSQFPNFDFLSFQFAICILHFAFFNLQIAFCNLQFQNKNPPAKGGFSKCYKDYPFFLISLITSCIRSRARSLLFSSTKVLIANNNVSSSQHVMFSCFIPSTSYVAEFTSYIMIYQVYHGW